MSISPRPRPRRRSRQARPGLLALGEGEGEEDKPGHRVYPRRAGQREEDQPSQSGDGQQRANPGLGGTSQDQVVPQGRAGLLLDRDQHRHDDQREHRDDDAHRRGVGGLALGLPIEGPRASLGSVGFFGPGYVASPHYRRVPQPKGSKDWGTLTPVHGVMRTGCSHSQTMPSPVRKNSPYSYQRASYGESSRHLEENYTNDFEVKAGILR